jgi:hypothetical protein
MLIQPTHVVAGGASGRTVHSSEVPAIPVELANLRDELAAGEVTTLQAASRLTALLTTAPSKPRTDASTFVFGRFTFPRWTFGGYCTVCTVYACQDPQCAATITRWRWKPCTTCKGSMLKDIDYGPDSACDLCEDCAFGAVQVPRWEQ